MNPYGASRLLLALRQTGVSTAQPMASSGAKVAPRLDDEWRQLVLRPVDDLRTFAAGRHARLMIVLAWAATRSTSPLTSPDSRDWRGWIARPSATVAPRLVSDGPRAQLYDQAGSSAASALPMLHPWWASGEQVDVETSTPARMAPSGVRYVAVCRSEGTAARRSHLRSPGRSVATVSCHDPRRGSRGRFGGSVDWKALVAYHPDTVRTLCSC